MQDHQRDKMLMELLLRTALEINSLFISMTLSRSSEDPLVIGDFSILVREIQYS